MHGKRCQDDVDRLKARHADMPLSQLGLDEIEAMLHYWKARPITAKGTPAAPETVRRHIKRIREFLKWLHRSPAFAWRTPTDYVVEPIRLERLAGEKTARLRTAQVKTYSREELVTLYRYATPLERFYLLLGINCGFGNSEIVNLQTAEVHLDLPHGHYTKNGKPIVGSWIKQCRNKTGVYGEWKLWPETVEAIKWFLARRKGNAGELVVTEAGRPINGSTKGGNRIQTIPNLWTKLTRRIQKDHSDFPSLSFNKLRKTAQNIIRKLSNGELAGIFGCRGKPVATDDLLDVYTDRPFFKVFKAQRKARKYLSPMFAAEPILAGDERHNPSLSLGTISKIKTMRAEGKKYREIAEATGVCLDTVRRYLAEP